MASFTGLKRVVTAVALGGLIALMACGGDPAGVVAPGDDPLPAPAMSPEAGITNTSQAEDDSVRTAFRKVANRELRAIAARIQRTGRLSRSQFDRMNSLMRFARRSVPFQTSTSAILLSTTSGFEGISSVSPGGSIVEFGAATTTGGPITGWLQQAMEWWIGTGSSTFATNTEVKIALVDNDLWDTKLVGFTPTLCLNGITRTVHTKDPFTLPEPHTFLSAAGPVDMGNCSPSGGSGGSCDGQIEFDPDNPCEPGSGGGGGGSGGGSCTEEWVIIEIWNDETGTWQLLWEGNVLVCD